MFALFRTEHVTVPALAVYSDGAVRPVTVRWPLDDLLLKDAGAAQRAPRIYSDSQGNFRWITVHPHGKEEEGIPVKIRESKSEPGVWHVVAGAGGKLNYLKLTGVKSPEQYKQEAADRRRAERAQRKAEREERKRRMKELTPEERERERAAEERLKEERTQAEEELDLQRQEFVANVAKLAGWSDDEWKFDKVRARLMKAGADAERIEQQERAHWKKVYRHAQRVVKQTRRQLMLDHEARLAAELDEMPLKADDPQTIALNDLDPDKTGRGLGYRRDITKGSDREITAALVGADVERLKEDLKEAQDAFNPERPSTEGRVEQAKMDLKAAELLQSNVGQSPEQLKEREDELTASIQSVKKDIHTYAPQIAELQSLLNAPPVDPGDIEATEQRIEQSTELSNLQDAYERDKERLKHLDEELTATQIVAGKMVGVVKGERKAAHGRFTEEREMEIMQESGPEGVARRRMFIGMLQAGLAEYRKDVERLKEAGAIRPLDLPEEPVAAPAGAAEILKHAKAFTAYEKEATKQIKSEKGPDHKLFGKGYFIETRAAKAENDVTRDVMSDLAEAKTRSFLRELEASDRDPTLLDLTETEKREALQRYLSAGTYNGLNNASLVLAGQALLERDVVDVLGAAGSAQVLAAAIHAARGSKEAREMAAGVAEYHLHHHLEASEEAVRTARELYEQAHEIELGACANPAELEVQQELNAQRRELVLQAREIMGRTLGELESLAALGVALKAPPTLNNPVHVNLGPIATDSAIRQIRGLGLSRDDYTLDSDGVNKFVTFSPSALPKLTKPVDLEDLRIADEVAAIKAGERDDPNWLPPGMISRPQTAFSDPKLQAESFTQDVVPFEKWGAGGNLRGDLETTLGARVADGEDPNTILPDVLNNLRLVPAEHREAVVRTLDELLPTSEIVKDSKGNTVPLRDEHNEIVKDEAGNPVPLRRPLKADAHRERLQQLAEKYVQQQGAKIAARYGVRPEEVATFHSQGVRMGTPEEMQKTADAMHIALAQDPRACVAFKPLAELSTQDQAALRHYFNTAVATVDPKTGTPKAKLEEALKALGPEPPKEGQADMFGVKTNPEWVDWHNQQKALVAAAQEESTQWSEYARHMGTHAAYQALQDRLKGEFLERFARTYSAAYGEPLRTGKQSIRYAERHLGYLDPAERDRMAREEKQFLAQGRYRAAKGTSEGGRFQEGTVKDRVERIIQGQQVIRQNQVGLFGGDTPKDKRAIAANERFTVGQRAEGQVASLMENVAQNFTGHLDEPLSLFPEFKMYGRTKIKGADVDLTDQQRTVKGFLAAKRIGAFLGTGSGKTPIAIGAFTAAASDPSTGVKRGIFVVPSNAQGQFHGEMGQFVKPGAFNWHAVPGASQAERMAAHRNPNIHMVVMTHQGLRDDLARLLAQHPDYLAQRGAAERGIEARGDRYVKGDEAEPPRLREWFMALPRPERARLMGEVLKQNKINYQASFLDEGHVTLDRKGKPDSLLSAMMTALSDNTPYYMAMTADPAKNDASEIRSQLDKLYPDGRYSDQAAWHKRYGLNTTASEEALRREVAPRFFTKEISPPSALHARVETVPLHPEQQAAYARVMQDFQKARVDRSKGIINVEAIKRLSPSSFEGQPEELHTDIARRVSDNLGIIKEAALARVVNLAPADTNGKMQKVKELLKGRDLKANPVVIFAGRYGAVDMLKEQLGKEGYRVAVLDGRLSTKDKDLARRSFQPDKGKQAGADVFVLSNAGATAMNLQRGQTLINFDTPLTAMVHNQRKGRIYRLGQTRDCDLIDLSTDTPFEARARARLARKYQLRKTALDAGEGLDDTGLAHYIQRAREQRRSVDPSAALPDGPPRVEHVEKPTKITPLHTAEPPATAEVDKSGKVRARPRKWFSTLQFKESPDRTTLGREYNPEHFNLAPMKIIGKLGPAQGIAFKHFLKHPYLKKLYADVGDIMVTKMDEKEWKNWSASHPLEIGGMAAQATFTDGSKEVRLFIHPGINSQRFIDTLVHEGAHAIRMMRGREMKAGVEDTSMESRRFIPAEVTAETMQRHVQEWSAAQKTATPAMKPDQAGRVEKLRRSLAKLANQQQKTPAPAGKGSQAA